MFAVKHKWRTWGIEAIIKVWMKGNYHVKDCYFCMIIVKVINRKDKYHVPDVPLNQSLMVQTSLFLSQMVTWNSDMTVAAWDNASEENDQWVLMTKTEFNDLNFSKESAQQLCSRLKEKNQLGPGTKFYWYRESEREFRQFFTFEDKSSSVYCNNFTGLIKSIG